MSAPDFSLLDVIRSRRPLIHCVSNLVSANDCANLALALGASPIMAQARQEMEAVAAASDAASFLSSSAIALPSIRSAAMFASSFLE